MPSPAEGINANKPEFKTWMPAEYEAGFEARFAGATESLTASHCWQAGWHDADLELAESSRQRQGTMATYPGERAGNGYTRQSSHNTSQHQPAAVGGVK